MIGDHIMGEQGKRPYKRKKLNLAVKREFQIWLLIRIGGVVIVSSLVAVLILYLYSRQEIATSFYAAHIQLRRVSDLLFPVIAAGAIVSLLSGLGLALFSAPEIGRADLSDSEMSGIDRGWGPDGANRAAAQRRLGGLGRFGQ